VSSADGDESAVADLRMRLGRDPGSLR